MVGEKIRVYKAVDHVIDLQLHTKDVQKKKNSTNRHAVLSHARVVFIRDSNGKRLQQNTNICISYLTCPGSQLSSVWSLMNTTQGRVNEKGMVRKINENKSNQRQKPKIK